MTYFIDRKLIKFKYMIHYRVAVIKDIDIVFQLIQNAITEMERHGIFQWDDVYPSREDILKDIEQETLYLAYEEADLVAIYVISDFADSAYKDASWMYEENKAYILHRFCVDPAYQNQGIGTKVLKHIENQVAQMGYESIRLDVFTMNPYAQKLYRKNGYEVRGYADWRKGRFNLMEKKLHFQIYGNPWAQTVILRLVGEHEQNLENEIELLKSRSSGNTKEWCYILIPVNNWSYEMTPWFSSEAKLESENKTEITEIETKETGAKDKLDYILNTVISQYESIYKNENRNYVLAGYSLAGLFALWASYQTDQFWGIMAASPSVWFPDWTKYIEKEKCKAKKVYLSLGSKEHKTRNQLMAKVADNIQTQYECLMKQNVEVTLEMNPGNHFKDVTERMIKGISLFL